MPARTQKLTVFAHLGADWAPCGQLTLTEDGTTLLASEFAYGLNYLRRRDALEVDPVSLGLADRVAVRGRRLLPRNNLPFFGGIRDATPDSWGRRVIEAWLKVPANSLPESRYLLQAGSDRVGALDVRPDRTSGPSRGVAGVHSLEHLVEAAGRIEEGLPIPAHLEAIFVDGTALGGARPKATVRDAQGVLWLAKFASRRDAFDVPAVECASLRLAQRAGLTVPPVDTLSIAGRRVMRVRRFDRYWTEPGQLPPQDADLLAAPPGDDRIECRLGFVSGLTLVGCDETESRDRSYADLAEAVRRYCHPSVLRRDTDELFRRMVYNIFVSNDDDHLRNHGFIHDPRLPGWRLSPLYDVLPRPSVATERFLHLGVGPQGRLATLDNALESHVRFALPRAAAAAAIADVWRVVREWRVYFEESGVAGEDVARIGPAFRHIDEISTPGLRQQLP